MAIIVILEDNEDRKAVMSDCLADRFHQYESRFFDEPVAMIAFLRENLCNTIVLSLDHDLEMIAGEDGRWSDPGTGQDVANYLAEQPPVCPVIIHTSNSDAAVGMEIVLQDAGWETHRVIPMDDREWIPRSWFRSIRNVIVGSAHPQRPREQTTTGEKV